MWLIGAVVCLLAANHGSNCSFAWAMDGCIVRCGIISSCQSAATSKIVKALRVLKKHVRSAIASTWTLPLPLQCMVPVVLVFLVMFVPMIRTSVLTYGTLQMQTTYLLNCFM